MHRKITPYRIGIIVISIFIAAELAFLLFPEAPKTLEAYTKEILAECKNAKYRPSCYDEAIPKLMRKISMEDAFQVTKLVQDSDSGYQYCHVLGHKLSALETKKSPNTWKDVIARCPSGLCSSGCIHGAFQERFRKESLDDAEITTLKPELADVCEERGTYKPTGLEQASCYHALGHLSMYITSGAIQKSVALCRELAIKGERDFSGLCFDGAFMQIFQPLEPEDIALVEKIRQTEETVFDFCSSFAPTEAGSCWSESWPLAADKILAPKGAESFCSKAPPAMQDRCFDAIFFVNTARFGLDQAKIMNFCSGLSLGRRPHCFKDAAQRLIEIDYRNIKQAALLCKEAEKFDPEGACFDGLVLYATFALPTKSEAAETLCKNLPESWGEKCYTAIHGINPLKK